MTDIPAGMVAWRGGDRAPEDFAWPSEVMLRCGRRVFMMPADDLRWRHSGGPEHRAEDIIAYTPRQPTRTADAESNSLSGHAHSCGCVICSADARVDHIAGKKVGADVEGRAREVLACIYERDGLPEQAKRIRLNDLTPAERRGVAAMRQYAAEAVARERAENERLSDILDTERYKVAIALQDIKKAIDGRRWLSEPGRGCYTYDDERYQQEFGGALDEIAVALEPLRKIAGDWSDCPRDPLRVAANRSAAIRTGAAE